MKAALINDLSSFGRCSLAAAMPVLTALDIQACALPTAVLSGQTGYESYSIEKLDLIKRFSEEWKKAGISFDGIYTGFFASNWQIRDAIDFIKEFKEQGTILLADPVMGDGGALYPFFDESIVNDMKALVSLSDITTPNLTEACLLTDTDYKTACGNLTLIEGIGESIRKSGAKSVVITGIEHGGFICNLISSQIGVKIVKTRQQKRNFSGTGDLFASILFGKVLKGTSLEASAKAAAGFISKAVKNSIKKDTPKNDGMDFERYLKTL